MMVRSMLLLLLIMSCCCCCCCWVAAGQEAAEETAAKNTMEGWSPGQEAEQKGQGANAGNEGNAGAGFVGNVIWTAIVAVCIAAYLLFGRQFRHAFAREPVPAPSGQSKNPDQGDAAQRRAGTFSAVAKKIEAKGEQVLEAQRRKQQERMAELDRRYVLRHGQRLGLSLPDEQAAFTRERMRLQQEVAASRQRLIEEQDRAYQRSLAADRARAAPEGTMQQEGEQEKGRDKEGGQGRDKEGEQGSGKEGETVKEEEEEEETPAEAWFEPLAVPDEPEATLPDVM